ncbi:hypothetical protein HZC07_05315 [Candidatus Micrarchaeota archaeon]|nr:hypothetical protein [Candidatus Micrarchaeota archaeon]
MKKLQNGRVDLSTAAKRSGFVSAALLTGSLALAGCGDTYNTTNIYQTPASDGGVSDASPATCNVATAPAPTCGSTVSGTLQSGQAIPLGSFALTLDSLESHSGVVNAVISFIDGSCTPLKRDKLAPGDTKEFVVSGETFTVTLNSTSAPGSSIWADLDIQRVCGTSECQNPTPSVSGVLNQGESLSFNSYRINLDDISVVPSNEPPSAILSLTDAQGNVMNHFQLRAGQDRVLSFNGTEIQVSVSEVAAGYTFGAKWANVTISSCQ